ncbi:MAG: hypothetical protein K6T28_08665 [Acidothermus sp.]|nr:hypothetical protein [Acidothermus sp.]
MKFPTRLAVLAAPAAALLLAAGPASAANPSITVSPSSGLSPGQSVHVTGSGFSPNEALVVTECAAKGASTSQADCNLNGVVSTTSDASGNVSATITVTKGPFGQNNVTCSATQPCMITVAQPTPNPTESAFALISFAPSGVSAGSGGEADHQDQTPLIIALSGLGAAALLASGVGFARRARRQQG